MAGLTRAGAARPGLPGPALHPITRRDKVRQAVSLWQAVQTQAWRQEAGEDDGAARARAGLLVPRDQLPRAPADRARRLLGRLLPRPRRRAAEDHLRGARREPRAGRARRARPPRDRRARRPAARGAAAAGAGRRALRGVGARASTSTSRRSRAPSRRSTSAAPERGAPAPHGAAIVRDRHDADARARTPGGPLGGRRRRARAARARARAQGAAVRPLPRSGPRPGGLRRRAGARRGGADRAVPRRRCSPTPTSRRSLVVDDGSTDGTAARRRARSGARVVDARRAAAGLGRASRGRSSTGSRRRRARSWSALDADTRPRPGLAARARRARSRTPTSSRAGARFVCDDAGRALAASGDARDARLPLRPARRARAGARRRGWSPTASARRCGARGCSPRAATRHAAGHMTDDAAQARALARRGWRVAFHDGGELIDGRHARLGAPRRGASGAARSRCRT